MAEICTQKTQRSALISALFRLLRIGGIAAGAAISTALLAHLPNMNLDPTVQSVLTIALTSILAALDKLNRDTQEIKKGKV